MMKRNEMANTRWIVDRPKNGSHVVRARANREVIGGLLPFRSRAGMGRKGVAYLATRVDGRELEFVLRFDACAWLMDGYDASIENKVVSNG